MQLHRSHLLFALAALLVAALGFGADVVAQDSAREDEVRTLKLAQASAESDRRVKDALRKLREIEISAEGITGAMPQAANQTLGQLNDLARGLVLAEDKQHPDFPGMLERYNKVRGKLVKIVVSAEAKRLSDITVQWMRELRDADPALVQSEAEVAKWRDNIAVAKTRHEKLPLKDDPNVQAFAANIGKLEQLLEEKLAYRAPEPVVIWSAEWPEDRPVLIDSVGARETDIQAWVHQTRPLSWVPLTRIFVRFAGREPDDVVLIQVLRDGQEIGKAFPCRSTEFVAGSALIYFECRPDKEYGVAEPGDYAVRLTYKQTLSGTSFDLATLRLEVLDLLHGAQNNPTHTFGEDHDMQLSVATIEEDGYEHQGSRSDTEGLYAALAAAHGDPETVPHVTFRTWIKSDEPYRPVNMSCLYKGKKIADVSDSGGGITREYWSHGAGGGAKKTIRWEQLVFPAYGLKVRPRASGKQDTYATPVHWLNENPGDYRCVITRAGEILKELQFSVGADGKIAKPACQDASMKTLRHVILVRQVDKKVSTVDYDADIGREQGYFGNVEWTEGCPPMG